LALDNHKTIHHTSSIKCRGGNRGVGHESDWVGSGIRLFSVGHFGFWVVSGRVRSIIGSFWIPSRIRSGRFESLVSGHFGFWVISDWVRSVIGSSSVVSFQVLSHIMSGRVSGHLVSVHFELYQTGSDQIRFLYFYVSDLVKSDELDPIEFISDTCIESCRFHLNFNWNKLFLDYHFIFSILVIHINFIWKMC
jgi:hypothetical protein